MATTELEPNEQTSVNWKSPLRILVRFFKRSRDQWKAKYVELKQQCKLLSNQVRAVQKSREKWREDAVRAQGEVVRLRQELCEAKKFAA
jgi:hypothetical protein